MSLYTYGPKICSSYKNSLPGSTEIFNFSPELLNKLAPTRLDDFEGTLWYMNQLDYPIHKTIKNLQTSTLNRVFSSDLISRVHDNERKFDANQEIFTLFELFERMNIIVWRELQANQNINSFRRELQSHHLNLMHDIYKNKSLPVDAQNLAFESIKQIYGIISDQDYKNIYDNYTVSHLSNTKHKIEQILDIDSSKID